MIMLYNYNDKEFYFKTIYLVVQRIKIFSVSQYIDLEIFLLDHKLKFYL